MPIQSLTQVDSIKCQRIIYILLLESYHFYLVSSKTIQATGIRSQLVWRQLQLVEGQPEHHIDRTSLVYKDTMHPSSCRYNRNHYWVIVMLYDILAIGLCEDEVDIGSLICLLYLHCHHLSCVLLPLGGGASSF